MKNRGNIISNKATWLYKRNPTPESIPHSFAWQYHFLVTWTQNIVMLPKNIFFFHHHHCMPCMTVWNCMRLKLPFSNHIQPQRVQANRGSSLDLCHVGHSCIWLFSNIPTGENKTNCFCSPKGKKSQQYSDADVILVYYFNLLKTLSFGYFLHFFFN